MSFGFCLIEWIDGRVKPMVCLLPFKANTAKQSHGAGRGRQTNRRPWPPPSSFPKQQQTRHKGGGERQHQQYYDWLWWVSICSKKVVAWLSIAFFCFLVLIGGEGGVIGGTWWGEKNYRKRCSKQTNIKKDKTIWLARGEGEFQHLK